MGTPFIDGKERSKESHPGTSLSYGSPIQRI